jgi:hypothetical protein
VSIGHRREGLPDAARPIGITCAACHQVHGDIHGERYVRLPLLPAVIEEAVPLGAKKSNICLPCHLPDPFPARPEASAGAIWLARGGVRRSGDALIGKPVHVTDGGCLACHGGSTRHRFGTDSLGCRSGECHPKGDLLEKREGFAGSVAERANAVLDRLAAKGFVRAAGQLPHADPQRHEDLADPLDKAAHNALLVVEDPAAWVHDAVYARQLLDEAEALLDSCEAAR